MKTNSLLVVLLCFLCLSSYAQKKALSTDAVKLFDDIYSNLTTSEKNRIAELSEFNLNPQDQTFYRSTDNGESIPYNVRLYVFDLTKDGVEEIGIVYYSKKDSTKKYIKSMLFVKDLSGSYKLNLDLPGEFYFLDMNTLVFPDIFVKNSTLGLATYRWNGNQYNMHTFLKPGKLKKFTITTMAQTSKKHSTVQVGE